MATLADFITELEADVDAIAGGTRSRMSQDYGEALSEFTALGTTKYQIRATHLNYVNEDSNAPKVVIECELFLHHALASISDEQAYQSGQMATDQLVLLERAWWESMASVFALVADFPVTNEKPERTGKRITYSVGVQLALA